MCGRNWNWSSYLFTHTDNGGILFWRYLKNLMLTAYCKQLLHIACETRRQIAAVKREVVQIVGEGFFNANFRFGSLKKIDYVMVRSISYDLLVIRPNDENIKVMYVSLYLTKALQYFGMERNALIALVNEVTQNRTSQSDAFTT